MVPKCNTQRSESTKLAPNCNSECSESTKSGPKCNSRWAKSTKIALKCNSHRAESTKLQQAAAIFAQKDFVTAKDVYRYTSLFVLGEILIIVLVGIPLAQLLF